WISSMTHAFKETCPVCQKVYDSTRAVEYIDYIVHIDKCVKKHPKHEESKKIKAQKRIFMFGK
ncbi:MAG: hypothetical protein ACTSYO_07625, partial [Candidatus Ranarchaeia archaeon]